MSFRSHIFSVLCLIIVFGVVECRRVKRVIGGAEVPCGVAVAVASLRNADRHHLCGAFVLTSQTAITAAHCVEREPREYSVHLNNYCNRDNETSPYTQVLEVFKHPLYDRGTRAHDIAVLRLKLDFDDVTWLDDTVLPNSSFGVSGDCIIYGYGYRDLETKETSRNLLAAKVKIISLDECTEALGKYVAPEYDFGMICALGDGVDACEGDSGGPLICAGKIEGIASYGRSCGLPGQPGVYTSIGPNLQWLHGILEDIHFNYE